MGNNNCIIHVSKQNKFIFDNIAKKELVDAKPELEGSNISQNHLMSQLLRYFIGNREYERAIEDYKNLQ